jgi:hypothetical protein
MPHKVVALARREEVERDRDELKHLVIAAESRPPAETLSASQTRVRWD